MSEAVPMLPDLRQTIGYLVADEARSWAGSSAPVWKRARHPRCSLRPLGVLSRRRCVVPAETIQEIDDATGVVGLNVERESIRAFL